MKLRDMSADKNEEQFSDYKAMATEAGLERAAMNQKQYEKEYGRLRVAKRVPLDEQIRQTACNCLAPCATPRDILNTLISFIPIFRWLPRYKWREDIVCDVIGGITTGIMHVPQGLAYALLAGVDPVYGLYSSCFPAFFYMLFGTSRHTSLGSFAVVTLMAGIANDKIMETHGTNHTITVDGTATVEGLTPIQVASTLTFCVGLLQLTSGILRLEFIATYFSDPLVSGFTTGAAVHVLVAQIDDIFGLMDLPKASGPAYIFVRLWDIVAHTFQTGPNWAALITSAIALVFLYVGKEIINPILKKKGLKVPIPFELILIIIATLISFLADAFTRFDLPIVGNIPTGPPKFTPPVARIIPDALIQALGITVVTVAIHISMAKMIAKRFDYEIDSRQELYALGAAGMLGGLVSCYPVSTALSRTLVNVNAGTKTQLSTIFSCSLLLLIIFVLGSLLKTLPMCILASIIIMALKAMFQKYDEVKSYWKVSRTDLAVWIVAFLSTVIIDVMEGLTIAILFALLTVVFRSQWPKFERVLGGDVEASSSDSDGEKHCPHVCVFRFDAPLLFTNVERFKRKAKKAIVEWDAKWESSEYSTTDSSESEDSERGLKGKNQRFFIIDCSSIAYADFMGAKAIAELAADMKTRGLTVYLAAIKPDAWRIFRAEGLLKNMSKEQIFPTLHDALAIVDRFIYEKTRSESPPKTPLVTAAEDDTELEDKTCIDDSIPSNAPLITY